MESEDIFSNKHGVYKEVMKRLENTMLIYWIH